MSIIDNLKEKAFDAIDKLPNLAGKVSDTIEGANFDMKEVATMYLSFIEALLIKADPNLLKEWKAQNTVALGLKIPAVYLENKENAAEQKDLLADMLRSNTLYLEAAYIADDVYYREEHCLIGGWKRCTEFADLQYNDEACALKSCLYSRNVGGRKEYIYATAGTNPLNAADWKNNFEQLYGNSTQYQKALEVASALSQRLRARGASLTFVGHSLGGGEAINNAIATGHRAIVFNPAGVSGETKKRSALMSSSRNVNNLVTVFLTTNDLLNWMQDMSQTFDVLRNLVPCSEGKRFYIYKEYVDPIRAHLMETMIVAMEDLRLS